MSMEWAGNSSRLKVTRIPLHAQLITRMRSRRTASACSLLGFQAVAWFQVHAILKELNYTVGAADVDRILAWIAVAVAGFATMKWHSRRKK